MFYVISPPEETDWHIGRDEVVAMLKQEWPGAEVKLTDASAPSARDVVWRLQFSDGELEGSQDRAGQAHYLDGPPTVIARFASWWRSRVPARQQLILFDESYSTVVKLTPRITEEDILADMS
jgi:hypothetical protein